MVLRSRFVSVLASVGFLIVVAALGHTARAEHTRVTNPSALGVEVLGRGLLYSIYFDHVLSDELAAGFGFGTATLNGGGNAILLPVYASYYFMREQGSIFVTAGAAVATNAGDAAGKASTVGALTFSSSPVVPNFGIGYENRAESGFLFRFTAYGMIAQQFSPWAGFSFGYSF